MTRYTRIALAIILSSPLFAIERAAADENEFHPYVLAPGLVGESFLPSRNTTWWGGGLQVVLYGWSDNNERPGPGQGSVFAQFSELAPPTVSVTTFYQGASAEVVESAKPGQLE